MKSYRMRITSVLIISVILAATISHAENAQKPGRQEIDGYMRKAAQLYEGENYTEAIEWYRKAADCGNAWGQNNVAWILATFKMPEHRDGKLAVFYALKAVEQEPKNAAFIRTLAAAYARNREFDKAVRTQKSVIALLQDESNLSRELREFLQNDHKEKLERYQQDKAYVDEK